MWSDLLLISNCTSATYWRTWNELHLLMGNVEPVLMCWEKPGEFCPGNWLHDGSDVSWEFRLKNMILGPRRSLICSEPFRFQRCASADNFG